MNSIIKSRLINAERSLTENIKGDIQAGQLGNLLRQSGNGLYSKMEFSLADGFSERVMLKIISIRLKRETCYSFFTYLLVANFLMIAVILVSILSSSLGSFDYQPLTNMPSLSYILPGLMVLLTLAILDQGLIIKATVNPMPLSLN
tara:strand:+ start:135 stop:572 length:438 start_codon:yes stop_codon:yes gene_type:complete